MGLDSSPKSSSPSSVIQPFFSHFASEIFCGIRESSKEVLNWKKNSQNSLLCNQSIAIYLQVKFPITSSNHCYHSHNWDLKWTTTHSYVHGDKDLLGDREALIETFEDESWTTSGPFFLRPAPTCFDFPFLLRFFSEESHSTPNIRASRKSSSTALKTWGDGDKE